MQRNTAKWDLSPSLFVTDIKSEYSFLRFIIYLIEIQGMQREYRRGPINYTTNGENLCIRAREKCNGREYRRNYLRHFRRSSWIFMFQAKF